MKKWISVLLLSVVLFLIAAFSVGAEVGDCEVSEIEPNGGLASADVLYHDDTVKGVASGLTDMDYFSFTVQYTGDLVFACISEHQTLKCILLDEEGTPIAIAEETTVEGIPTDMLGGTISPGKYYFVIGNYDVHVDNEYLFYFDCPMAEHRPHVHSYTAHSILPTCTESGYTLYTCKCGDTYTDAYIDPLGHSFVYTDCETRVTCQRCTETDVQGHLYDAACDSTCGRCNHVRSAAAHTYKKVVTKATMTKNGKIATQCTACNHVKSTTTIYRPYSIRLSATSYTYNGAVRTPSVTVKDYAGKTLVKDTDYTVTYSSGRKNAGTYKVTVKFIKNITGSKPVSFTIKPISISRCSIKVSDFTYTGKSKAPTVTVKNANGTKLSNGTHYKVLCVTGCKNVGTHTVKIVMKGNYSGSKSVSFKIKPASISKCSIKVSDFTYTGKSKAPAVTVKNANGTKLSNGTHYKVLCVTGCKNVGTHTVKIVMKGNYSGSKSVSFKINPTPTTISHLTLYAKSVTVHLEKKTSQVSGYQVQHSAYSSFKNATTVTAAGYQNTTPKVKVSGAKGTYHLRVRTYRTVNGVKYYSAWTTYKYVR